MEVGGEKEEQQNGMSVKSASRIGVNGLSLGALGGCPQFRREKPEQTSRKCVSLSSYMKPLWPVHLQSFATMVRFSGTVMAPLSVVSLSSVLVTCYEPWSKIIKWTISEVNNS